MKPEPEYTPNCRCKRGEVRTYLTHENAIEGKLIVDHEPPIRQEDHPDGNSWNGGLCIARAYVADNGQERQDFVLIAFSEVERVRDACNVFLFDHRL